MLKNFKDAQRAVGFYGGERIKGDFYSTPPIAVEGLLSNESFGETILEPCCGNGSISEYLIGRGYKVISRDLYDWQYGETGKDFLKEPVIDCDAIITNPPFKLSVEFTIKALECTKAKSGKVAMLNRIQWLEGIKRKKLFENHPLSRVLIFSKRLPRFNIFGYEGKTTTSLIGFAWFVFDWNYVGEPKLGWI